MKQSDLLKLVLFGLLTVPVEPQTRGYAKFGPHGETIGLFNLLKKSSECDEWRVYSGIPNSPRMSIRRTNITYRFTLTTVSPSVAFDFTLGRDEIPFGVVDTLLMRKQRLEVRACRKGRKTWSVQEIAKTD